MLFNVVAKRGDRLRLAAQFVAADGAVDDFVVRTRSGTRCFFLILTHRLTFGVASCRNNHFPANGTGLSGRARRVLTGRMRCFFVLRVAARAVMPMRRAVRAPFALPIMTERRTFVRSRISCFAAVALCSLRAVFGARCVIIRNIARKAMAERGDRLRLAAQFVAANGAVDDFVIRTRSGTRCSNFLLTDGLTFGVAECLFNHITADGAGLSGSARRVLTGNVCCFFVLRVAARAVMPMRRAVRAPFALPIMAERFDLHIRRVVAAGTGVIRFPTDLGTRCRFCFVMFKIMAERVNDLFLAAQFIAADGAVNDLVIRAGHGAACRHFVFANGFTFGMAKRVTVCSAANFTFGRVGTRCLAAAVGCLVVDLVAAAAFMPMRGTVRRPFFGPIMAERFDLHISRVIAAGTGIVGIPTDFGTRRRFCFVMLKIMAESFERLRRSCDVFLATKHDLSGVGPQPFRFAFGGRRYDARDRAPGCSCSLLVAAILTGASKRCRCRRITFPRPFGPAVLMTERLAVLKNLFSGLAADRAALVVSCFHGTRCRRDEILFVRVLHIDVLRKIAVLNTADLALCKSNARRGAAAMVCLVVDLVAAATFVPM